MSRFAGGVILAIGACWARLSGLCTWNVYASGPGLDSNPQLDALSLEVGSVMTLIGLAFPAFGARMLWKSKK
jgi:hypothetical protein